ncbi:flagellar filament capping protein FliD [Galenea microaerophila]
MADNTIGLDILNSMGATTFDVKSMAKVLANADVAALQSNLETKQKRHDTLLSGFDLLKKAFEGFKSQIQDLTTQETFKKMSITSSDPSVIDAQITGDALSGTYNVEVQSIATAQTLATNNSFNSLTDTVGTGDLTINVGGVVHTITIDSTNNTLAGIQQAIQSADIGVIATTVNTGSGYKLMLTSNETGANNQIQVSVANDGDGNDTDNAGLSQLVTANMTETVAAQDATVVVNGLTINSSQNSLDEVIPGVELTLNSADAGTAKRIDIRRDTSEIGQKVQDFVDLYNSMNDIFKTVQSYEKDDPNSDDYDPTKGALSGNSNVRLMKDQMKAVLQEQIAGLTGTVQSLADVGIKTKLDGSLELDTTALNNAIAADPDAVGRLFAASGITTDPLVKFTGSNSNTVEGTYQIDVTTAAEQATLTGSVTGNADSFTITSGSNDTLTLKLDGEASGTLTLAAGTYTGADLAKELQTKINNDPTFKAKNSSIVVSYDSANDQFTFTSSKFGSASSVEFTGGTVLGDLGLNSGDSDTGVDVGGTLTNSETGTQYFFTGQGQHVTVSNYAADDMPKGLEFDIGSSAIGSRGTITFTRGYADKLTQLFDQFNSDDGLVGSQIDKLNKETSELADEKAAIEERYNQLELKYRIQFGALQSVLKSMRSTQEYLAASLNQSTSTDN